MGKSKRRRQHRLHLFTLATLLLSFSSDVALIVDASSIFLDRKIVGIAVAGIFGGRRGGPGSSTSSDLPSSQHISPQQQRGIQQPPPPPQPPGSRNTPIQQQNPVEQHVHTKIPLSSDSASVSVVSEQMESPFNSSIPQPPIRPMTQDGVQTRQPELSQQALNDYWSLQQQQNDEIQLYQEQLFYLHRDLESAYVREQQLLSDLRNLTAVASEAKQREKLHMHQLDVLTERVIDVETAAAHGHNQLLEYQMNCTELFQNLELQQKCTDEWREKCESLRELHEADEARIKELQEKLKTTSREVETLATSIEKHRLFEQGTTKKKTKKKMGFLAWLFNFGVSSDDDDEDYREIYEEARSSLLVALQSERNSVSELEAALVTLQQNNSVISEQVQSRDQIIEELNNRIAVFEEDKVVLKAALRQLQLEMNDEAPKTHKLIDDLAKAQSEIERLSDEIGSLMESHRTEMSDMQLILNDKVEELRAAEANLTIIGTYVEKLEERLADFTVARREIEERELACSQLEKKVAEVQTQRESLMGRVRDLEKEHDELKALLSELVEERSKLLENTKLLSADRSALEQNVQSLRQSYAKLDNEARNLREQYEKSKLQLSLTERKLNETTAAADELLRRLEASESEKQELRNEAEMISLRRMDRQEKLDEVESTKQALEKRVKDLELSLQATLDEYNSYTEEAKRAFEEMERQVEEARKVHREADSHYASDSANVPSQAIDDVASLSDKPDSKGSSSPSSGRDSSGPATVCETETSEASDIIVHALVPVVSATPSRRNVPLRKIRKFFARATGIHGLFIKPTHR